MKKIFLLPLIVLMLTGCGQNGDITNSDNSESRSDVVLPSNNTVEDKPKERVQLTKDNFSTYVAINCNSSLISNETSSYTVVYYAYFIGADYCKFVDCKVTYLYSYNGNPGAETTVPLTLSGDGQANPFYATQRNNYYYTFQFVSASGTVMVYR